MKKQLIMGTQAFVKMSNSFAAARKLSKIANARILYLSGQFEQAAKDLQQCLDDRRTYENTTAMVDLIRVRRRQHNGVIPEELQQRAVQLALDLNLSFETQQLQLLRQ